jgi:hypothetical protein
VRGSPPQYIVCWREGVAQYPAGFELCYSLTMQKKSSVISRSVKTGRFLVGRKASIKISKVEGLIVTRDMRDTFRSFDEKGLSPEARRAALANKYGKKDR